MALSYVQANTFYLAGGGVVLGATSITLNSFTDIYGNVLTMASFGTKGYITLEPNTTNEEGATFTGVTANTNGTYTLTGISTILAQTPYTETSGLVRSHFGGTAVVVTDNVAFWNTFPNVNNAETIAGLYTFTTSPVVPTGGTGTQAANNQDIANAITGASGTATNLVYGTVKLSVAAASPTVPIAVGDNDPRVPTLTEAQALVGQSGTAPSSSNKYEDNADTSTTASAGKLVRALGTGLIDSSFFSSSGSSIISLLAGESISAGAPVSAGYFQSDGGVKYDNSASGFGNAQSAIAGIALAIAANSSRLIVADINISAGSITAIAFNGVAMTLIPGSAAGGQSSYYAIAPATGTHNLTASFSGSLNWAATITSYYNAKQTGFPDVVAISPSIGTTTILSITPVSDGALVHVSAPGLSSSLIENSVSGIGNVTIFSGDLGLVYPAQALTPSLTVTSGAQAVGISIAPATTPTYGYVFNATAEAGLLYTVNPSATTYRQSAFIGFALATVTVGQNLNVQISSEITNQSGLIPFGQYFLANTPGTISKTAGTNSRKVGIAINSTSLVITNIW